MLDVLDQTAVAKVTANWGIDYMLLAKFDGRWKIVEILWQSHPPKGANERSDKTSPPAARRSD